MEASPVASQLPPGVGPSLGIKPENLRALDGLPPGVGMPIRARGGLPPGVGPTISPAVAATPTGTASPTEVAEVPEQQPRLAIAGEVQPLPEPTPGPQAVPAPAPTGTPLVGPGQPMPVPQEVAQGTLGDAVYVAPEQRYLDQALVGAAQGGLAGGLPGAVLGAARMVGGTASMDTVEPDINALLPGEDALSAAARFGLGMAAFGAGAGMPNPNEWVGKVPASARNITPRPRLLEQMASPSLPQQSLAPAMAGFPLRPPGFEAPPLPAPPAPEMPPPPVIPPRPAPSGLPQRAPGFEAPFPPLPEGSRAITDEASIATVKRLIQRAALSGMPRRPPGFEAPLPQAEAQSPAAPPAPTEPTPDSPEAAEEARIDAIVAENAAKHLKERQEELAAIPRPFADEPSPGPGITRYRLQPLDYDEMLRPRNPNAVKAAQQIAGLMRQGHEIQDMHVEPDGTIRFNLKAPPLKMTAKRLPPRSRIPKAKVIAEPMSPAPDMGTEPPPTIESSGVDFREKPTGFHAKDSDGNVVGSVTLGQANYGPAVATSWYVNLPDGPVTANSIEEAEHIARDYLSGLPGTPTARGRLLRPLDTLSFKPSKAWTGSYEISTGMEGQSSVYVTDGHTIFLRSALQNMPKAIQRELDYGKSQAKVLLEKDIGETFQAAVKAASVPARITGWIEPQFMGGGDAPNAIVKSDAGTQAVLNAQKVELARRATGFDSVRLAKKNPGESPVALYRGTDPVGLIVPMKSKLRVD